MLKHKQMLSAEVAATAALVTQPQRVATAEEYSQLRASDRCQKNQRVFSSKMVSANLIRVRSFGCSGVVSVSLFILANQVSQNLYNSLRSYMIRMR